MCGQSAEVWIRQFYRGLKEEMVKQRDSFLTNFLIPALRKLDSNTKHQHCFETDGVVLQMRYGEVIDYLQF